MLESSNRLSIDNFYNRIRNAENGSSTLDLSGFALNDVPDSVWNLTHLKVLNLGGNNLKSISSKIWQLKQLESLELWNNKISLIPPEIGNLQSLIYLNLSRNLYSKLPLEIGKLNSLLQLDISENRLVTLPPEIGKLVNLESLDAHRNKLNLLPKEIGNLKNLKTLNLNSNEFTHLQPELSDLTNLDELHLDFNNLLILPHEVVQIKNLKVLHLVSNDLMYIQPTIGGLENLKTLNLGGNPIKSLPPEIGNLINLEKLSLNRTHLKTLPSEISKLSKLRNLSLLDTQLPIPVEIVEKTDQPQIIINYYFAQLSGIKKSINEAKVIVVGQGSVGKTSLVRRIIDNGFDVSEIKTEGITIERWYVNNQHEPNNHKSKVNLNIWDFGGQEIMHATHQFFLTKRSLYILVLDSRLTQEENRVEYWLKIIQSFGGESPILIIGNKIDQHPLDIDRTGLQKKYLNIVGILETSAATGSGVEDLKDAIAEQVYNLPHVRDLLPETWFTVKTKLEELGRESNFITQDKYLELCTENEVTDETSQRTLIGFLHDLGVVLHFQDDPRLEALGILNPQWVTNGVYKILNSHTLFQNKGALTVSMLDEILNLPEYPRGKRLFIVDMMKKFELCYDLEPDKTFLVPDLLPKDQPDLNFNGIPAFEYAYPVLPSSVITRFIVRMNQKIYNGLVWRTGVLLKIGENIALVKADIEDRKITIAIDGLEHTRRDALSAIRYQLDEIHSSIKGLNPQKRIPVPGAPNAEPLEYDYLLMLEREGQEVHLVKDGTRLVKVNVRQVLSAIESEADRKEIGGKITNIYIGGDVSGSTIVAGDDNQFRPKRSLTMDIPALAVSVSSALAPFFPYIIKGVKLAGQKWFESLGEKAGEEAVTQAVETWEKIKEKSAENKTVEGAAMMLSDDPGNATVQKMFADAITDVMKKHPGLAKDLSEFQKSAPSITIDQRSGGVYFEGSGNVTVKGDVVGRDQDKGK